MKEIAIVLLSFFLIRCDIHLPGTNTGNPGLNASPAEDFDGVISLSDSVCNKIKSCFTNIDLNDCVNQVIDLNGYTSELGTVAGNYTKLSLLISAVKSNQVSINFYSFEVCSDSLSILECTDSLVQDSYSDQHPFNFESTNILFRSSTACRQIYY